MGRNLILFASCYAVWCLLNWLPGPEALALGIPIAGLVALATRDLPVTRKSGLLLQPARLAIFCAEYIPYFWWQHFKANLDVACRVLHPRLPIRPGIIRVETKMKSDMGVTILANSISLMPGTTTIDVDTDKERIYVHCMNIPEGSEGQAIKAVVHKLETMLKKVFN
jgi:multicomponent Na+:H+ antiporter subunit E